MAITYIGQIDVAHDGNVGGFTQSLAALSLQQNDLVVVGFHLASNTDRAIGVNTAGYAEEAELFANDTYDANLSVSWKIMGATPDSDVTVGGPGSSTHPARIVIRAYRGVDTTTPMDVTRTTATGINGLLVDPPSITPTTSGSMITVWGVGAAKAAALSTPYASSDLASFSSGLMSNFYDLAWGVGHKDWTSGAFDAAAWTGTESTTTDSWACIVLALRPAAGGITGTLSAAETGSDTFSGSGTVEVSGTLSASETGGDALAASGVVDVSGSLAGQEAGADAMSASGAVDVSGSMAASESGSDTFAATGDVSSGISGTMAAQEAGSDTLAASGSVDVAGGLAAAETGTDTFSGTGSVAGSVTGTMDAVETGSDAIAASGSVDVAGAAAAVETGDDTMAAAGSVTITLTMSGVEAGSDTATITGVVAVLGSLAAFEMGGDVFEASSGAARRRARPDQSANGGTLRPSANNGTLRPSANNGTVRARYS